MEQPKLNIMQRLLAVQKAVGYVKKTVESGSGGSSKGVSRDHVVEVVRPVLIANGIYVSTSQVGPGTTLLEERTGKQAAVIYTGMYETRFINVDDPKDFHAVMHEAQGRDFGDKAPGKAATYAEKLNMVKGLQLETGIADEDRNEEDDSVGKKGPKAPIKQPVGKSEADAEEAKSPPASKGLLKQIEDTAKALGKTEALDKFLKAQKVELKDLTSKQAKTVWEKLNKTETREPGSDDE